MIVNVEMLDIPRRDAAPVGPRHRNPGPPGRFRQSTSRSSSASTTCRTASRRKWWSRRERIPAAITARRARGPPRFPRLDIVTIDGETARDFDDAVWVDRLPNGNYALHVHIADVSHYVRPGTPIDREARLRGTSVYFPDRAVPMLPFELSTNHLLAASRSEDRLVLSALLEIDHQGEVVGAGVHRGVIRSAERMTYTNVHLLLEGDAGAARALSRRWSARFELMRELALILNRKRVRRGSIDFDLPEPLIEFDEFGAMTGVTRAPRNIAHRLIEEFMLAANEAVASHLEHALARLASTASTKSPIPSASWNSKRSPRTSAIRSASARCR